MIYEATNVPIMDRESSDPVVVCRFQDQVAKTTTREATLNPKWNQVLEFPISSSSTPVLDLVMYDRDPTRFEVIGQVRLVLTNVQSGTYIHAWHELLLNTNHHHRPNSSTGQSRGQIEIGIVYSPPPDSMIDNNPITSGKKVKIDEQVDEIPHGQAYRMDIALNEQNFQPLVTPTTLLMASPVIVHHVVPTFLPMSGKIHVRLEGLSFLPTRQVKLLFIRESQWTQREDPNRGSTSKEDNGMMQIVDAIVESSTACTCISPTWPTTNTDTTTVAISIYVSLNNGHDFDSVYCPRERSSNKYNEIGRAHV